MDRNVTLTSGQVLGRVHSESDCFMAKYCALHNPSDHRFRNNLLYHNTELGIWERILPDGVSVVPDPDNLAFQSGAAQIIYENKAECIKCGDQVVSTHRHHYQPCYCGDFAVDGGHDYLRRVGGPFIERSVIASKP